jgi:hypothetical protein
MSVGRRALQLGGRPCSDVSHIVKPNQNDQRSAADPVAFSPINVTADSFVAGSQEDPAAVAAGDAARDLARWPDRPGPSPVACG